LFLLLLVVVPALALLYRWLKKRDEKARAAFADAGMSARLGLGNKNWKKKIAPVLIMAAATFAAVAIARPLGPPSGDDEKTAALDVIVALDISDSMGVADVKSNRLTSAKEFVKKLVLAAPNNRYGLVLFSGDAVITCPATPDHDAFLTFVDDADFQRANLPGTAIGEAILTAATRFKKDELPRVVLVVTDGENTYGAEPVKAAETAKQAGLKVYAAGVGTIDGGRIPGSYDFYGNVQYKKDKEGNIVVSKLDEDALTKITDAGGGRYFAESESSSVRALAGELMSKSKKVIKDPFQGAKEYGSWFVFVAAVLVAIAVII
jgi:Ca-activated chloride channel family protein